MPKANQRLARTRLAVFILAASLFFPLSGCGSATTKSFLGSGPYTGLYIAQGFTNETSAQFSVLLPQNIFVRYYVRSEGGSRALDLREIYVRREQQNDSDWSLDLVRVEGLQPNKTYSLEVRDKLDSLVDTREFSALNFENRTPRILVAGGLDEKFSREQRQIWSEALIRNPDLIFLTGDSAQVAREADILGHVNASRIWRAYIKSRIGLDLYKASRLVPIFPVWNEKDFGQEEGNRDFHNRRDSANAFRLFFPQDPDLHALQTGPGTARFFSAFSMSFAFMDNRYFRNPPRANRDEQTVWGAAQERWLYANIYKMNRPTWIINGDPIYGNYEGLKSYGSESPDSLKLIDKGLSRIEAPIGIITGGISLVEISKVSSPAHHLSTFEITTSGMHNRPNRYDWKVHPNSQQLDGASQRMNYLIFEPENKAGDLTATLTAYSLNNEILFQRFISIEKATKKLRTY